jgi:hypothetical protein
MAEEIPSGPDPEAARQDDILDKIDQLLNRHRPKPPDALAESAPLLTDALSVENSNDKGDGIPTLTDVVGRGGRPAKRPARMSPSGSLASVLILRRMAIALDAEHLRLLAQIDRSDAAQARMLDRLVTELKRALPGAVHAALSDRSSDPRSEDDGQL